MRKKIINLQVCEEGLEWISKIKEKLSVIIICGKARTGKWLIAGELICRNELPCSFDLGHTMDACT